MDESLATNPPPSTPTAILLAAARVFAEAGYRASTVQMIAKEAGFTPPTVYAHFGSKRALFESLVVIVLEELFVALNRPQPEGLSLAQELELRIRDLFEVAERRRDAFAMLLRHPYDLPKLTEHSDTERLIERHWETFFAGHEETLGDRTPAECALVLEGVLTHWVKAWIVSGEGSAASQARRVVEIVLRGITPMS